MTVSDSLPSLDEIRIAVSRVAAVLRRLASAASAHFGRDCILHAKVGQRLLADLGVPSTEVLGFAAWRVGRGDGDVISHTSDPCRPQPGDTGSVAYHAWLEHNDFIIDFTTYQFYHKARELDAADGGGTSVDWCPHYLLLPRQEARSHREVTAAPLAGAVYYERRPEFLSQLEPSLVLDDEDVAIARILLANPGLVIKGPNNAGPGRVELSPRRTSSQSEEDAKASSFKPEVQTDASGRWYGNALRFATREEAESNVADLASRWRSVIAHRAAPSDDPVNSRWIDGHLIPVPSLIAPSEEFSMSGESAPSAPQGWGREGAE